MLLIAAQEIMEQLCCAFWTGGEVDEGEM